MRCRCGSRLGCVEAADLFGLDHLGQRLSRAGRRQPQSTGPGGIADRNSAYLSDRPLRPYTNTPHGCRCRLVSEMLGLPRIMQQHIVC